MKNGPFSTVIACALSLFSIHLVSGQRYVLDEGWHHIRNMGEAEWATFPTEASAQRYLLRFEAPHDSVEHTLTLRQYDVKLHWQILLNGTDIGSLISDEKDIQAYFKVPPGILKNENTLEIASAAGNADDIRLGEVYLIPRPVVDVLSESRLDLEVLDAETHSRIPARITITNGRGILQTVSGVATEAAAIRPGYVYTGTGGTTIGLPAGTYNLYATRGFEYGVDSIKLNIAAGESASHRFVIAREVPTTGWISADTHIHTVTWSGHGDASASERAISIAGEGIELPIMTDHNAHVNLMPFAVEENVSQYFTPVTGNEVTTPVGHFNIFPVSPERPPVQHQVRGWQALARDLRNDDPKAIILNHGRDIHMGFRPFDSIRHLSIAGMRLDRAPYFFNAMEVINSGSQQTDQQELMRDWFGLLNYGARITPVGSSDSHDVSRYFVGQARTYIRGRDDDASSINIDEALRNFIEGSVMVNFGLLAEIEINDTYGPGELVPASDEAKISVRVLRPAWTKADKVALFVNGSKIREEAVSGQTTAGVHWERTWYLTPGTQDLYLVAVAEGPADNKPFWPIAKPYQPTSPEWSPRLLGISGAVWIDADKNGKKNSARDYALHLYEQYRSDLEALVQALAEYDEAVAVQAAAVLHRKGIDLKGTEVTSALRRASPQTKAGFDNVVKALTKAP